MLAELRGLEAGPAARPEGWARGKAGGRVFGQAGRRVSGKAGTPEGRRAGFVAYM